MQVLQISSEICVRLLRSPESNQLLMTDSMANYSFDYLLIETNGKASEISLHVGLYLRVYDHDHMLHRTGLLTEAQVRGSKAQ